MSGNADFFFLNSVELQTIGSIMWYKSQQNQELQHIPGMSIPFSENTLSDFK